MSNLNTVFDSLMAEISKSVDPVEKSYTKPSANHAILNQQFGRGLDIDEGQAFADLVVNQSGFLQEVFVDNVDTLKSTINIYEGNGALSQTPNGTDPFATSGNLASFYNLGYDVNLETMQFLYRIIKEQLLAIMKKEGWSQSVNERMFKVFSNELLKLALFGVPASGADDDISKGYNYVGNTPMGAPRIGVRGWLDTIKKGYTYVKDGATLTAAAGGVVNTYDTSTSKYKAIDVILTEMAKAYPSEFADPDVKIFCSSSDFIEYKAILASKNATVDRFEAGDINGVLGTKLVPVPFLKSTSTEVTVSGDPYYPGIVLMGRAKDLVIKQNIAGISMDSIYDPKLRTYDTIYDVPLAFGAIIQRFVIAYRVRT